MNKFIYKVVKWLEDPESVSQEEREENKEESFAAYAVLDAYAAAAAAYFAAENNSELATLWVSEYLRKTGENKQDYINAIWEEK